MPNHCGNKLIIRGSVDDRRHFLDTTRDKAELDLNKIIPTDDSYQYHVMLWGTKWGCYDSHVHVFDDRTEITFLTAWCPYTKTVQIKMTELFPMLSFELLFAEQGREFYGWYKCKYDDFTGQVVFVEFTGELKPVQDCVSFCKEECDKRTCEKHCYAEGECEEHEFYLTGEQAKYQELYEISG